jgi:hypothetical protein
VNRIKDYEQRNKLLGSNSRARKNQYKKFKLTFLCHNARYTSELHQIIKHLN